ncbi:hypothetical protein [Nocardia cyriacigeorgica]|uniref:hypothetical protein n=1 Tax=Nocardia cyriacigeorgica TaxID=135487 RepID=UPI002455D662|nr:hypothetical protein [Nocardia cyriacigeorgica]
MDRLREIEIAVLREVIEAVDARLDTIAHLAVPRSQVYAAIIYAVLSSARSTGHYGAGMLANAPLLDAILAGGGRGGPRGPHHARRVGRDADEDHVENPCGGDHYGDPGDQQHRLHQPQ